MTTEIESENDTPPADWTELDTLFDTYRQQADPEQVLDPVQIDELFGELLKCYYRCITIEAPWLDTHPIDINEEIASATAENHLHASLRLAAADASDTETHSYHVLALQTVNRKEYCQKIHTAIETSGAKNDPYFQHLAILRTLPFPMSDEAQQATMALFQSGGKIAHPKEDDLRTLWSLDRLEQEGHSDFNAWLKVKKPTTELNLTRAINLWKPPKDSPVKKAIKNNVKINVDVIRDRKTMAAPGDGKGDGDMSVLHKKVTLPLGMQINDNQMDKLKSLPLDSLAKHVLVLGDKGAGKTLLLRRLVEDASLMGIPALIIDGKNEFAQIGDRWIKPPNDWTGHDKKRANRFHRYSDVKLWTPGMMEGNPLTLDPFRELSCLVTEPEKLELSIALARYALTYLFPEDSAVKPKHKKHVFNAALHHLAQQPDKGVFDLVQLMSTPPEDLKKQLPHLKNVAASLAARLTAGLKGNTVISPDADGQTMDTLLLAKMPGKTRISVVSLAGLDDLRDRRQLVSLISLTLSIWAQRTPTTPNSLVKGLLVIDDVSDFLTDEPACPCAVSLIKLAVIAARNNLGLIFSTSAAEAIDQRYLDLCGTKYFGRNSDNATLATFMKPDEGDVPDLSQLPSGQFYLHRKRLAEPPVQVMAREILSQHPHGPLSEEELAMRTSDDPDFAFASKVSNAWRQTRK